MTTKIVEKHKFEKMNQNECEAPKKKQKLSHSYNKDDNDDDVPIADQQSITQQIDDDDMSGNKELKIKQMNPSRFQHDFDQKQFEEIIEIIDEAKYDYDINIIQLIGEYSTGEWKICGNIQCREKISVLYGDTVLYDDYQSNAQKLGYKYCRYSNNYFCFTCMHSTEINDIRCINDNNDCDLHCKCCLQLIFKSNDTICAGSECSRSVIAKCIDPTNCKCHYNKYLAKGIYNECNLCKSKFCLFCWNEWGENNAECGSCLKYFCQNCMHYVPSQIMEIVGYGVCNNCYDGTIIQCTKCHKKCKKWWKSKTLLLPYKGNDLEGVICSEEECQTVICKQCDLINCHYLECKKMIYERKCSEHRPKEILCWNHRKGIELNI